MGNRLTLVGEMRVRQVHLQGYGHGIPQSHCTTDQYERFLGLCGTSQDLVYPQGS